MNSAGRSRLSVRSIFTHLAFDGYNSSGIKPPRPRHEAPWSTFLFTLSLQVGVDHSRLLASIFNLHSSHINVLSVLSFIGTVASAQSTSCSVIMKYWQRDNNRVDYPTFFLLPSIADWVAELRCLPFLPLLCFFGFMLSPCVRIETLPQCLLGVFQTRSDLLRVPCDHTFSFLRVFT